MEAAVARSIRLLWLSTIQVKMPTASTRLAFADPPDYAELPNGDLAANAFYFLRLPNSD
jgi:hypothetical protein